MEDIDGEVLVPVPTPETKPLFPGSIYAVNKMVHECDFLIIGRALGISTVAMRRLTFTAHDKPYPIHTRALRQFLFQDLKITNHQQSLKMVNNGETLCMFATLLVHMAPP